MAFNRKSAPSAKSLDLNGNSDQLCYSSGQSPVNSKGQVTDKAGQVQNWPFQKFTIDNELNPLSNEGRPAQLSSTPQAYGDFASAGRPGSKAPTLG